MDCINEFFHIFMSPFTIGILIVISVLSMILGFKIFGVMVPGDPKVSLLNNLIIINITLMVFTFLTAIFYACGNVNHVIDQVYHYFRFILFGIIFVGLPITMFIVYIIWKHGHKTIPKKFKARQLADDDSYLVNRVREMASSLSIRPPMIFVSERDDVTAMCFNLEKPVLVISRRIVQDLEDDELDVVISHELAHLKYMNAKFSIFCMIHRRFMLVDLISKYLVSVKCRKMECLADEVAAKTTKKPLALASALLKIGARDGPGRRNTGQNAKSSKKSSFFSRSPPLADRVKRLINFYLLL